MDDIAFCCWHISKCILEFIGLFKDGVKSSVLCIDFCRQLSCKDLVTLDRAAKRTLLRPIL